MNTTMTYQDAINQGYKLADCKYQRGYISRKTDQMAQQIHTASGSRAGEMYVLLPCWASTQYCIRQYLAK